MPAVAFVGQSNGRAFGTTGTEPLPTDPNTLIWNTASKAWQVYEPGVNSDTWNSGAATPQKWGTEAGFVAAYRAAHPAEEIRILKLAKDSTTMAQDWTPAADAKLFAALVGEVRRSGSFGAIAALAIMQGEHDALNAAMAAAYAPNLTNFIEHFRLWCSPLGRIIMGRITPSSSWPYAGAVRAAQARLARDNDDIGMVDTDDYALLADGKHYTADSVLALGADMYAAYAGTYPALPVRFSETSDDKNSSIVLSNGKLTAEGGGTNPASYQTVRCDTPLNGLCYWEMLIEGQVANINSGIGKGFGVSQYIGITADSVCYAANGGVWKGATQIATLPSYSNGSRVLGALDSRTGRVWFGLNGAWNGDPGAGTGEIATLSPTAPAGYHRLGVTLRRSGDRVTLKATPAEFAYPPPNGFAAI